MEDAEPITGRCEGQVVEIVGRLHHAGLRIDGGNLGERDQALHAACLD